MAVVISTPASKGGVGKTTVGTNLAVAFALKGARVLLVDADVQANMTELTLGEDMWDKDGLPIVDGRPWQGLCTAIMQGIPFSQVIYDTEIENLKIIPHERNNLRGGEYQLEGFLSSLQGNDAFTQFKDGLSEDYIQKNFDLIFIDNPPSTGKIPTNALVASDQILIPSFAEKLSQNGIRKVLDFVKKMIDMGDTVNILGVVVSKLDKRSPKSVKSLNKALDAIWKRYQVNTLDTRISVSSALSNCETVFEVFNCKSSSPLNKSKLEYEALAEEVWTLIEKSIESRKSQEEVRA